MSPQARMTVIDDATPLNGPSIDVGARIAWTLRMARVTARIDDRRIAAVAADIGTSATRMSRAETGHLRDGSLIDGYERALALPAGALRAPIDVLARTFPAASPPDVRPGRAVSTVAELSRLTEWLDAGEAVSGGDWLRWSRSVAQPGNIGLPVPLAQRVIMRLVDELARSCGHGYPSRYEALAKLRCSDYGFLVLRVAKHEVAHPHAQGLADLLSAVGESVTPEAVDWCLSLLGHERPYLALCGALALENMGEVSTSGTFWAEVVSPLVATFNASEPGSTREEWIAHLIRLVPGSTWATTAARPARPLPPAPEVEGFDRAVANRQWQRCEAVARGVAETVGVGEQPMLARLLFDIGYGHWETRAVTSYFLLGAVPALAHPLWERFGELVDNEPDHRIRHRMARRLQGALAGETDGPAATWLGSDDPVLRSSALQMIGSAGRHVTGDDLRRALREPATDRAATYSMGMSAHPDLPSVAHDLTLPEHVRGSAQWWLDRGARVAV